MLCHDVKRVIYFFLDGTLDAQRQNHIQQHLDVCSDCETRTIVHRRIQLFLKRRLAPISAPDRLKQRLSRSLRAFAE